MIQIGKELGWEFVGRERGRVTIKKLNKLQQQDDKEKDVDEDILEFDILATIPFDSTRKRMSVIVQHKDEVIVLSKGADNVMLDRAIDFTDGKILFFYYNNLLL